MLSETRKKANEKYFEKFDDIKVRVPKGKKEEYKQLAENNDMSLNALIIELLEEKIKGQ